jgi:hypothetical protein
VRWLLFVATVLLLVLACGRAGEEVVFSPEQTTTPAPEPTPVPTPTPIPTPTSDPWEEIFFPLLPQLRSIPGNENARVDWSSGVLARGRGFLRIQYPIKGVESLKIPIRMGKYEEEQLGNGMIIRFMNLPPEGRVQIGCTFGYPTTRRCDVVEEEGEIYLIREEDDLDFFFLIEANGITRWTGPVPPGPPPELYERARPLP